MGESCQYHVTMFISEEQEKAIRQVFKEKNWLCQLHVISKEMVREIVQSGFTDIFILPSESQDSGEVGLVKVIKSEVANIGVEESFTEEYQTSSMKFEAPMNSDDEDKVDDDITEENDELQDNAVDTTAKMTIESVTKQRLSKRKKLTSDEHVKVYKNLKRRVKCPLCDTEVASKSILKRHCLRRHPNEWFEFRCADCPSMFKTHCDHVIAVSCNEGEKVFKRFKPAVECIAEDGPAQYVNDTLEASENEADVNEGATSRSTSWAVKILKDWITEVGFDAQDFEKWSAESLDSMLEKFYSSLRTKKGVEYSWSSLAGIRSGLNRYLTQQPHNRSLCLMKDREFFKSNQFINKKILKSRQKNDIDHREPISDADFVKLYESGIFSLEKPDTLQNKVLFEILLHFDMRGKEGLRVLKKNEFKLETDSDGCLFISLNEVHRNQTADDQGINKKTCIYERPGDRNCPVTSFMKYISKLHPGCDSLLQRPKANVDVEQDNVWYTGMPVGVNALAQFMARLSENLELSMRYTNNCIRATYLKHLQKIDVKVVGVYELLKQSDEHSKNLSEKSEEI